MKSCWVLPSQNNGQIFSAQPCNHEPPLHLSPTKKIEKVTSMDEVSKIIYWDDAVIMSIHKQSLIPVYHEPWMFNSAVAWKICSTGLFCSLSHQHLQQIRSSVISEFAHLFTKDVWICATFLCWPGTYCELWEWLKQLLISSVLRTFCKAWCNSLSADFPFSVPQTL